MVSSEKVPLKLGGVKLRLVTRFCGAVQSSDHSLFKTINLINAEDISVPVYAYAYA